jgi:hypothetical protein
VAQPVHGVLVDAAGMRASTKRHAGTIKAAADPANTANAADMRGAKAGDRTNADATNVSAAAEGANMSTATEGTAHSASVTATASAAPRLGLYNAQARSQQRRRQNRHRFSHRLLHSVIGMARATSRLRAASDELEIGILPRSTIKMTFRHFTPSSRKSPTSRVKARPIPTLHLACATTTPQQGSMDSAEQTFEIREFGNTYSSRLRGAFQKARFSCLIKISHRSLTLPNGQFNGAGPRPAYVDR